MHEDLLSCDDLKTQSRLLSLSLLRAAVPPTYNAALPPGSLFAFQCAAASSTCTASPAALLAAGVPNLAADFDIIGSGCTAAPAAGQQFVLPDFTGELAARMPMRVGPTKSQDQ